MTDDSHDLTFEQAYERLEAIVARLESGDLSLEEAVALYEQGQVLAQQCGDLLDAAELRRLATVLAAALDGMGRALHRLAGKPLRARVAAELLELSDSDLSGRSPEGAPMVYITHDELATAVGSVRETVTKVVGELVRLGAIRAGYGKITVRDERVLREVAGE
mgnify:CR=1 FL=1